MGSRWVIFPRLSVKNHALIEKRNADLKDVFSDYHRNQIVEEPGTDAPCRKGIATQGVNFMYTLDSLRGRNARVMRVATPFPFPEKLALSFLEGLDEVLCVEELDPVIERALTYICGKYGLSVKIRGKLTGDIPPSGENSMEIVGSALTAFLGEAETPACSAGDALPKPPALPVRPPVLCAGCPHRASFYACLCMGAGIGIAQGVGHMEPDTKCFAFVGDSTFFASGITGTVNAFYNQADMTLIVLDDADRSG